MARVTISDVAKAAAVSVATVSRALNSGPRTVGDEYRQRVLAAAERLGYQADLLAQATSRGSTPTVALVVSDIRDPFFAAVARGAIDRSAAAGLFVTISSTGGSATDELSTLRALRGQAPRVTILATGSHHGTAGRRQLISALRAMTVAGGRVVIVGREGLPFDTVTTDERTAAHDLAQRLTQLGYRSPLMLSGRTDVEAAVRREEGIRAGLAAAGVPLPPGDLVRCEFSRDGAHQAVTRLGRSQLERFDVIIGGNDLMAIGAMTALREQGLRPGADLGITGFGDAPAALDVRPALTTVHVPLYELGMSAVEVALTPDGSSPQTMVHQLAVLVRDSTPARASPA